MQVDIPEVLRKSQLGNGLDDEQLAQVSAALIERKFVSGDVVFRQEDSAGSLFIVARGRVKISVSHHVGEEKFVDHLTVGEHFGEIGVLTGGRRVVTMTSVMDSILLELEQAEFERLMDDVPHLAANLSRTLGFRLRRETTGKKSRNIDRVIGLVHTSPKTHDVLSLVASKLAEGDETVRIVSDSQLSRPPEACHLSEIPAGLSVPNETDWVRAYLGEQTNHDGQTLLGLKEEASNEKLLGVLPQCQQVWWLVEPEHEKAARQRLSELTRANSSLVNRIHWVWVMNDDINPNSIPPAPDTLTLPTFKVVLSRSISQPSRLQKQSISRLVRHVRGTRLGLALGGGAARGLAHLGVLKVLEREDIYVDLITGTSAGALMALPYAFGWAPDFASKTFSAALTPSWLFRMLPRGKQWYMIYKFRSNSWDGMLREYFGDVQLDQLLTPLSTVTVDLITGAEVVRDTGDAVNGVLESINLPQIARPILRDGMALVDGGIINNVPSDLLPERGADMVIGVDISSQLRHRFAGNVPGLANSQLKKPGQFETIMRSNEVQDHLITALRTSNVDFMIDVDTSEYAFADFTVGEQLSEVGERAAEAILPELKRRLADQENSESLMSGVRPFCPLPVINK